VIEKPILISIFKVEFIFVDKKCW